MSRSVGVSYPAVNASDVADIAVPLPPADVQRTIAGYLDEETARIDELLAEQRKQMGLLDQRRVAEIDRLIAEGVTVGERLREVRIPWPIRVPESWPVRRLKFCVEQVTVGIVVTPSAFYADTGVPCLRGLNIRPGRVLGEDLVFMSDESNALHSKSILREGDVVVVRTGQAGAAAVVPDWAVGGKCH